MGGGSNADKPEAMDTGHVTGTSWVPVVSVLMLTYNHERHLAQAIESVMRQEVDFPFELLIGEDCSTDRSRQIALDFQSRHPAIVKVVTTDHNVGAYRNYLRLLAAARGQFMAQIDGDDYWLPGKLARQVAALQARPECVAVYTNAICVDGRGDNVCLFNDVGDAVLELAEILRRGNFLSTSTLLFRASLVNALQRIGHEYIDYQTHLTLAQSGSLLHIGAPMAVYRIRTESSMVAGANEKVRELYWQAIQDVPRERVGETDLACGIADFLRRVAFRAIAARDPALFRSWWIRSKAMAPCTSLRLATLSAASFVRIAAKLAATRLLGSLRGHSVRVLYPG